MPDIQAVLRSVDAHQAASLAGLIEFLRIPSVSTKPEHKPDMQRCADWLARQCQSFGLKTEIAPTPGHPIVLAKNDHRPGRPTVLIYGHYDVQPPEPLELWTTPAFDPTVRKDELGHNAVFARGAVDDKGQVWCHLQAMRAWHEAGGAPVNVTMLIEGEEEIGSRNLPDFVRARQADLKADIAIVSDTNQFARGYPAITYGLRGLVYTEVTLTAAGHDLHSGMFGGAVPNPANALCELLATLHDADGRVNIPGFYDDVQELTAQERKNFAALPFDEARYLADLKLTKLHGEKGFTTLERTWARPTCDINGLTSGYQGPGAKTVIASKASAKISMRLVPRQDPKKVIEAFKKAMQDRCPVGVTLDIHIHGGGGSPAVLTPITGRPIQLAAKAIEAGFGKAPVLMREGGSIPIVGKFKEILGLDTLLIGFGLPDDRVHSPNEKFDLHALHAGTRTAAALYQTLSEM